MQSQQGRTYYRGSRDDRQYTPRPLLSMDLGARTVRFGEYLSSREQEWLRDRINAEVRRLREYERSRRFLA